eukprot:scaffold29866_cov56-Phaeocystis_antarctica.AAC.3
MMWMQAGAVRRHATSEPPLGRKGLAQWTPRLRGAARWRDGAALARRWRPRELPQAWSARVCSCQLLHVWQRCTKHGSRAELAQV